MKKSELKNIIKDCIKEVIFEEGVLSGLINEVVQGLGSSTTLTEAVPERTNTSRAQIEASKRQVLSSIGNNAYSDVKTKLKNPELFEGTRPIPNNKGQGALSGIDPQDKGIDISNIPGAGRWAQSAFSTNKQ